MKNEYIYKCPECGEEYLEHEDMMYCRKFHIEKETYEKDQEEHIREVIDNSKLFQGILDELKSDAISYYDISIENLDPEDTAKYYCVGVCDGINHAIQMIKNRLYK